MPICSIVSSLFGIWRSTIAEVALFLEHADTETRRVPERKAKVRAAPFAHVLDVVFRSDAAHQFFGVFRAAGRPLYAVQNAMHPDRGRCAHTDVKVGSAFRHHQLQQIGHRVRHVVNL